MATNNALNNALENLSFSDSTISTVSTNANLLLVPNGTGKVNISNAYTLPSSDGTSSQALVTNGSGALSFQTIAASPFTWSVQTTSAAVSMVAGNGYVANSNSSRIIYTIPVSFSVGDTFQVCALSSQGFRVALNASQFLIVGNSISTIGTSGYIQSQEIGDWVEIVGVSTSTGAMVEIKVGNLTVN